VELARASGAFCGVPVCRVIVRRAAIRTVTRPVDLDGVAYSLRTLLLAPKGIGAANVARLAIVVLLDDDQIVRGHVAAPEGIQPLPDLVRCWVLRLEAVKIL
jgi:hypothetical protein